MTFSVLSISASLPVLGEVKIKLSNARRKGSHTTILTGRNGSGKSSILRDLVFTLRSLQDPEAKRVQQLWRLAMIESFRLQKDSQTFFGSISALNRDYLITNREALRNVVPRRLIALSFTPFDKFVAMDDLPDWRRTISDEPFYVYLG